MIDQIIIGGKASFDDFGASVAKRARKAPKKKSIKEKIPFSNITYDFSKINGEIYWEEAEHEYTFEIFADTPERLEEKKTAFKSWIMNVINEELHDPIIPDYHFKVTFDDLTPDDDEGLDKSTLTVKLLAYPYAIANMPREYRFNIPAKSSKSVWVLNNSSHRITPRITADNSVTITLGSVDYEMSEGTVEDEKFKLEAELNNLELKNENNTACNVSFVFYEEVF